jgi:aryl-alcohol dehydrogenase-like predicted oxidoreductase
MMISAPKIVFKGLEPVPPLGIGTWQWGDTMVWGFKKPQIEDAREAYNVSLQQGIRLIDTAELYGWGASEKMIGEFYQANAVKPFIVSKMFPYPWRLQRRVLPKALKSSLQRLGLSKLDLYLMHWPWEFVRIEKWADSLAEVYQAGLVRAVGVSNYNLAQLERMNNALAKHKIPLAANQIEYHLLQRQPEQSGLLKAMQAEGIVAMAYSPLAMGWLTGKYSLENPPPTRYRAMRYAKQKDRIPALLKVLAEVAKQHQAKPAQIALSWCIHQGSLPIPGAKNARQAQNNASALKIILNQPQLDLLDQASRGQF